MKVISKSLAETEKFAKDFDRALSEGTLRPAGRMCSRATLVGLHGDLGSGKTAFVKLVAKILGVKEEITSPTFVILKNYQLPATPVPEQSSVRGAASYKLLHHIDAYRLEKGDELAKLGFDDLLKDPKNLIFLEWPERVVEILPKDYLRIDFKFVDETTREISVES